MILVVTSTHGVAKSLGGKDKEPWSARLQVKAQVGDDLSDNSPNDFAERVV